MYTSENSRILGEELKKTLRHSSSFNPLVDDPLKSSFPMQQNVELEQFLLLASKVELMLWMTLDDEKKLELWFPGKRGIKNSMVKNNKNYSPGFNKDFFLGSNGLCIYTKQMFYTQSEYNQIQTALPYYIKMGMAHFQMIKLFSITNNYPDLPSGQTAEETATYQLRHNLGISDDSLYCPLSENELWKRSHVDNILPKFNVEKTFDFIGERGELLYRVVQSISNGQRVLLPVVSWMKHEQVWPVHVIMMPSSKHPLFNLNKIEEFPQANIYLTEHIDVAGNEVTYSNKSYVWTSWYGGKDTIEQVQWSKLYGRKVYYILFVLDQNKELSKENIKTALSLYRKFLNNAALNLNFTAIMYKKGRYSKVDAGECVQGADGRRTNHLFNIAEEYGVKISKELKDDLNRFGFSDELENIKKIDFIIKPVIKKKSLCIVYATAGLGKSWLAISIGLAISGNKPVFDGWDVKSRCRVYYVSGEMGSDEISERIRKLKPLYHDKNTPHNNFIFRRVNVDLSQRDDQLKIEMDLKDISTNKNNINRRNPEDGISLIILDNLSCLVSKGDYPANWNTFFHWIETLKEQGYAVLLVHHSNKTSGVLGTSAIKNKTDIMIEATEEDEMEVKLQKIRNKFLKSAKLNEDEAEEMVRLESSKLINSISTQKVEMYLNARKLRSVAKKDFIPLKISLDLSKEVPCWKTQQPDYWPYDKNGNMKNNRKIPPDKKSKSKSKEIPIKPSRKLLKIMDEKEQRKALLSCIKSHSHPIEN